MKSLTKKALQRAGVAAFLSVPLIGALAQSADDYDDQYKRLGSVRNIASYGADLFGDQVSLYTGGLEFVQQDVLIPGNNALQVAVDRRRKTGDLIGSDGLFGDWDLDIPNIHGVFPVGSGNYGWAMDGPTGNPTYLRCSQYREPKAGKANNGVSVYSDVYWSGNFIHLPGKGDQEILARTSSNSRSPGNAGDYPLVTHDGLQVSCGVQLASPGFQGEGFRVTSPDGVVYQFDWMSRRFATELAVGPDLPPLIMASVKSVGDSVVAPQNGTLHRDEIVIFPTKITDRFGNFVNYKWDTTKTNQLNSIEASDGRKLTFTYSLSRIDTVSDGTNVWKYGYGTYDLTTVTLPDASKWQFNLANFKSPVKYLQKPNCENGGTFDSTPRTGSITHPSNAVGTFEMTQTAHGRSMVYKSCLANGSPTAGDHAEYPRYYANWALTKKSITGPGIYGMSWDYSFPVPIGSWATCTTNCGVTKAVTVTDANGVITRHVFGTVFGKNDGQLARVDEGWKPTDGTAMRSTINTYASWYDSGGQPWPQNVGSSYAPGDHFSAENLTPLRSKDIYQQGAIFSWMVASSSDAYDYFARPLKITRSSNVNGGSGYSRAELLTYNDYFPIWVLGRPTTVTETSTGAVMQSNTYDTLARLKSASQFGVLKSSYTYNTDGTLATVTDGAGVGHQIKLASYKRGIPQSITYPTGDSKTAVVNDYGRITSLTNEAGTTTTYDYDAMGRVKLITYPIDTPGYKDTTVSFAPMASSELGLPVGFWKQTVTTNRRVELQYFDALWRPVVTERYDSNDRSGTDRFTVRGFNIDGQIVYESYPANAITGYTDRSSGTFTEYDALKRVWRTTQDSELGGLVTTTDYLSPFAIKVTDPRTKVTTTKFQAFDDPAAVQPISIVSPLSVTTAISRNIFGEPTTLTRSGSYNSGTLSASRSYVYDAGHRLCKTIEPETGATVQAYDLAGNVQWSAEGQSLPSTIDCSQTSVPGSAKVTMGYDTRNRLTSVTYGDGVTPSIDRTWTPDGLPRTVSRGGATPNTWTYDYNNRRLLTQEALSFGGNSPYVFKRAYNIWGDLGAITYPTGSAPSMTPNVFGEQMALGTQLTGVARYANGAVGSYSLLNGTTHSVGMNARYLPFSLTDTLPDGTQLIKDSYSYDAAGNVLSITDNARAGKTTRSMVYDDRDRLTKVTSAQQWASAIYDYDPLDNLRKSTLASRVTTLGYNPGSNRLESLNIAGTPFMVAHDDAGRLTQRGAFFYHWDQDHRMIGVTGAATEGYEYDGLGHRVLVRKTDGSQLVQIYTSDNLLRMGQKIAPNGTATNINYYYLDGKLVAELTGASMIYMHTDALGSPVARTDINKNITARTQYEPYGDTYDGTDPVGIGYAGHVNDISTGLSYQQQRYYDPLLGRFITPDPVVTNLNSGGNFNRYWYGNNSPYRYRDPDGRAPIDDPVGGGGRFAGGGLAAESSLVGGGYLGAPRTITNAEAALNLQAARAANGITGAGTAAKGAGKVGPATDRAGNQIGRIVVDSKGNAMLEPVGGGTTAAGKNGVRYAHRLS